MFVSKKTASLITAAILCALSASSGAGMPVSANELSIEEENSLTQPQETSSNTSEAGSVLEENIETKEETEKATAGAEIASGEATPLSFYNYTIPVPSEWTPDSRSTENKKIFVAGQDASSASLTVEKMNITALNDDAVVAEESKKKIQSELSEYTQLGITAVDIHGAHYIKMVFIGETGGVRYTGSRLVSVPASENQQCIAITFMQSKNAQSNYMRQFVDVAANTVYGSPVQENIYKMQVLKPENATDNTDKTTDESESERPEDLKEAAVLDANYLLDNGYYSREALIQDLMNIVGYDYETAEYGADHSYVEWYNSPKDSEEDTQTEETEQEQETTANQEPSQQITENGVTFWAG